MRHRRRLLPRVVAVAVCVWRIIKVLPLLELRFGQLRRPAVGMAGGDGLELTPQLSLPSFAISEECAERGVRVR